MSFVSAFFEKTGAEPLTSYLTFEDVSLDGNSGDLDGTLKWSCERTVVVQGKSHSRCLAIRIEKSLREQKTLDTSNRMAIVLVTLTSSKLPLLGQE